MIVLVLLRGGDDSRQYRAVQAPAVVAKEPCGPFRLQERSIRTPESAAASSLELSSWYSSRRDFGGCCATTRSASPSLHFMNAVVAGEHAAGLPDLEALASPTFKDFQDDWGPTGYYGPVRSYHYEDAEALPKSGSGVLIVVDVSPYSPFPAANDSVKQSKTKEVRLIVEFSDQSIAFQP